MVLPKLLTTLYILLATFLLSSFLLANPASAAISTGGLKEFQESVGGNKYNKESFDAQSVTGLFNSLSSGWFGCLTEKCQKEGATGQGGVIMVVAGGMDWMTINQPASGTQYFADIGRRLNIVQPAYAQETGFQQLSPLLAGWRAVRNMSYVLFVIVFIALGLAIMFRFQINPQTTVTIQSALPRVIIALIFVTFSYAIAGLLVDLMKVSVNLSSLILNSIPGAGLAGFFEVSGKLLADSVIAGVVGGLIFGIASGFLGGGPAAILPGAGAGVVVGAIGASLIITLAGILLLFALVRIFFIQLMAFIGIAVRTLFGPLIIIFNALPGGDLPLGWIRPIVADLSVFVVVPLIFGFASFMMTVVDMMRAFNFPVGVPVISGLILDDILKFFLVVAILLMIPNIVNMVKEAINRSMRLEGPAGLGFVQGRGVGLGIAYGRERWIRGRIGDLSKAPVGAQARWRALYSLFGGR